MASIVIISKTHGTHVAYFDDSDSELVLQHTWSILKKRRNFYAVTSIDGHIIQMHNLITGLKMLDHVDRNGLNNFRSNIRPCNMCQNGFNRGLNRNNTTGYKGVSFDKSMNKFVANIHINGRKQHLGYRDTPIEAAKLYNDAALNHIGEFAYLNSI